MKFLFLFPVTEQLCGQTSFNNFFFIQIGPLIMEPYVSQKAILIPPLVLQINLFRAHKVFYMNIKKKIKVFIPSLKKKCCNLVFHVQV